MSLRKRKRAGWLPCASKQGAGGEWEEVVLTCGRYLELWHLNQDSGCVFCFAFKLWLLTKLSIYVCASAQEHRCSIPPGCCILLKYTVLLVSEKRFHQQIIYFSVRTGKTIQQIFLGNVKKKQMHSMELVVACSAQIFSFCSLTDSLEIGVVNHKENPFHLLLPTSSPLHPDMHLYLHTCHSNVSTQAQDRALLSLICLFSDLYFWKGLSLLSFRIFWILTLFSTEIVSLGLKMLVYAEQKTLEFLEQKLVLSYTCHLSTQSLLPSLSCESSFLVVFLSLPHDWFIACCPQK